MMTLKYTGAESLNIIKSYHPKNWVKHIEPSIRQICAMAMEGKSFQQATTILFEAENNACNANYIVAAHQHIQNQLKAFKTIVNQYQQFKTQLIALEMSADYSYTDKAQLRTYYRSKMEELNQQKNHMLIYDEVIACLDLKNEVELVFNN